VGAERTRQIDPGTHRAMARVPGAASGGLPEHRAQRWRGARGDGLGGEADVGEDLLHHGGLLDGGEHAHAAAAAEARKHVDLEDALEQRRPRGRSHAGRSRQYLLYHFFDELGVGTRIEWWKAQGTSYYAVTGGLNIKPVPNLIIRPEGRFQWSPSGDDGRNPIGLPVDDQGLFGIDVILTF
jgi:hypothetical protein